MAKKRGQSNPSNPSIHHQSVNSKPTQCNTDCSINTGLSPIGSTLAPVDTDHVNPIGQYGRQSRSGTGNKFTMETDRSVSTEDHSNYPFSIRRHSSANPFLPLCQYSLICQSNVNLGLIHQSIANTDTMCSKDQCQEIHNNFNNPMPILITSVNPM